MRFVTLIPQIRNDDSPVSSEEFTEIISRVTDLFLGATIEGETDGFWINEGRTFRDRCWRISVVCERAQYFEAREMVIAIGKQLGQLAMYFEVQYFDGVEIIPIE